MCHIQDKWKDTNWHTVWVSLSGIRRTNEMNENFSCPWTETEYRVFLTVCLDLPNFSVSVNQMKTQGLDLTRSLQKLLFFFFLNVTRHTFSHWSACLWLTLFCYIAGSTIKTKTFKTVLHFKEFKLFTKNSSCRLDVIADLHQQCYHIWSDVNKELL